MHKKATPLHDFTIVNARAAVVDTIAGVGLHKPMTMPANGGGATMVATTFTSPQQPPNALLTNTKAAADAAANDSALLTRKLNEKPKRKSKLGRLPPLRSIGPTGRKSKLLGKLRGKHRKGIKKETAEGGEECPTKLEGRDETEKKLPACENLDQVREEPASEGKRAAAVALVEAAEEYERVVKVLESNGDTRDTRLTFTNMKAAALDQLYQEFELTVVDIFRGAYEDAAEIAEEEDAAITQYSAVLKAATGLVTEIKVDIDIVKNQISPSVATQWQVEALWISSVAHVCCSHIVQQIGGPDGQNLPELCITQLLELVAWVEYFRKTIEEIFPEVASMHDTKKTYFVEEQAGSFVGDKRTINMKNSTESLAWVNNMLWEVHRLAQEEFLVRTRSQTDEWLDKVYGSTVMNQSSDGKLFTTLCGDVFSFSSVQLRTIRERLSKKSDALILAVCIVLSQMRSKQVQARNNFLQDLATCCAASNDFTRMGEKCEEMISELMSQSEFSEGMIATLEASSDELISLYSSDAVYSARSVHIYVFDQIEEDIGIELFEQDWEEQMVNNDLAKLLVRTLENFRVALEHYMDEFMVVKSVMSLMSGTVVFYTKCLLQRAEKHRNNKRPYFGDVKRALDRMTGDIKVMRDYFEGLVPQMPSLKKNMEKEFEILATIHELMSVAAGFSVSDAEDFILVLQKRVRDVGITKHIVGDLWHLVAPAKERYVWELVESMEEQLVAIAPEDPSLSLEVNARSYVKGLRLDEIAVGLYVSSCRKRPIKATAAERVEKTVRKWKKTWSASVDKVNNEEMNIEIINAAHLFFPVPVGPFRLR